MIALYIAATLSAAFSVLLVLGLFIWAARMDGEEDRKARPGRRR